MQHQVSEVHGSYVNPEMQNHNRKWTRRRDNQVGGGGARVVSRNGEVYGGTPPDQRHTSSSETEDATDSQPHFSRLIKRVSRM